MKRLLVTGAAGLLGAAIVEELGRDHEVTAADHAALDITDVAAIRRMVTEVRPAVIVNCAAYNDVDGAEDDAPAALRVNAFGVRALAAAARDCQAAFVHYSTDFVFDGESARPYTEEDPVNPRNTYAASKLVGEWFAADAPRHYVLRVESLFGPPPTPVARRGSVGTIVDRIRNGEVVPVFVDRTVSPAYTPDVAAATRAVLDREVPPGVYHCVNDGAATWRDVAEEVARQLGAGLTIKALTLETFKARAPRPRYCAMSPARLASLGVVMPPWRDAIARYLRAGA
ncbi:MAG TPA: dTDP-4-dehydrorhamnose reductase [Vicinamibacterales bacterium]|jgi:dTDP-4-dehydrorhamnose reductase